MKKSSRLVLHQETLKNLSEEELRKIEGGIVTVAPFRTCAGCPPPDTETTCATFPK